MPVKTSGKKKTIKPKKSKNVLDLVYLLKKLISFRTVSRANTEIEKAFAWIQSQLKDVPLYIQEKKYSGYPSLIITTRRTKSPKVWLYAHIDVVPASHISFKPKIKKNRLYGRGAIDMKFAIACYVKLLKEIGKDAKKYNIGVMITPDEELGGEHGAKAILADGYSGKVALLPDGGFNWQMEKAAKAGWHLEFSSHGKSAHSSRPWKGDSAVWKLANFLRELEDRFEKQATKGNNHWHDTITVGTFSGGEARNAVPEYAHATVNIRLIPTSNRKKWRDVFKELKKKHPGVNIKEVSFYKAYENNISGEASDTLGKLIRKKKKKKYEMALSHGGSDASFFIERGMDTIVVSPKGGDHHSDKEWIDIKSLKEYYEVLKGWIEEVGKN